MLDLQATMQTFFEEHHCTTRLENRNLTVLLTKEMDQRIMNRPFYWQFMKSTKQIGEPKELSFVFEKTEKLDRNQEYIHIGSPRIQQIFSILKSDVRFARLYEQTETQEKTALFPTLMVNLKIEYAGRVTSEQIYSIGIQLMNGKITVHMIDRLKKLELAEEIPDYCYVITPLIKIEHGFQRIDQMIMQYVESQSHDWATESLKIMQEEISQFRTYFDSMEEADQEFIEREISGIKKRFSPEIHLHYLSSAIVYLKSELD